MPSQCLPEWPCPVRRSASETIKIAFRYYVLSGAKSAVLWPGSSFSEMAALQLDARGAAVGYVGELRQLTGTECTGGLINDRTAATALKLPRASSEATVGQAAVCLHVAGGYNYGFDNDGAWWSRAASIVLGSVGFVGLVVVAATLLCYLLPRYRERRGRGRGARFTLNEVGIG